MNKEDIKRKWLFVRTLTNQTTREFFVHGCPLLAKGLAFHAFISLFSVIVFVVSVFSFFLGDVGAENLVLDQVVPIIFPSEEGQQFIRDTINFEGKTRVVGFTGMIFTIFLALGASGLFGTLRSTINRAWGLQKSRPPALQKLIDISMVPAFGLFILMSVFITTTASIMRSLDLDISGPLDSYWEFIWSIASLLIPGVLSFCTFSFMYWFLPHAKVKVSHAIVGGFIASLLFEIAKNIFVFGVGAMISENPIFGTLGIVVGFLYWLYISSIIVLLGAELTSKIPKAQSGEFIPKKLTWAITRAYIKGLFVHQKIANEETKKEE